MMEKNNIVFKLINGYYIRVLDDRNWVVAHKEVITKGGNKGKMREEIDGYYRDLERAWDGAVIILPLLVSSKVELKSIVKQLKELKITIK